MKICKLLITVWVLFVWTDKALAGPLCLPSATGLQAYTAVGWTGGGDGQNNDTGCIFSTASIAPAVNQATSEHAQAYAMASYGINSASVSGDLTASGGTSNAFATSLWTDMISITGGTGTGEITFGAHLSGTFTDHTETNFTLAINQGAGGYFTGASTRGLYSGTPGGLTNFSQDVTLLYIFTYGVPFALTGRLDINGYENSLCCGGIEGQPPFSANFSHTAILDTVVLPTGALLNSLSGVSYPAQVTAVPEPATLALLSLGMAGLGFGRRKRGKKSPL